MNFNIGIDCPICGAPAFFQKKEKIWKCTRMSCGAKTNQYNWKGKKVKKNGKKFEG